MVIRNAIYAEYKGKEYRVSRTNIDGSTMINSCKLISGDKIDLEQNGFSIYILPEYVEIRGKKYKFEDGGKPTGSYYKIVTPTEIGEIYDISPYAIYKGHRFGINSENETEYYLGTGDTALANSLGFEMVDREVYRKWIPKKDMEKVYEVKTLLPNFFK